MPLYEYRCQECEGQFEVLQRMNEGAEAVACPSCGAKGVEKQFSTFSGTVAGARVGAGAQSAAGCGCGAPSGFS